jgi:membrane protein
MRYPLSRFKRFFWQLIRRFIDNQGQMRAATLTFTTLFCVVPFIIITFTVFSLVPTFQSLSEDLHRLILDYIVPGKSDDVQVWLEGFLGQARALTLMGVGVLILSIILMLRQVENTFNAIWGVEEPRKGLSSFLLYWAMISLGPVMLGGALMVNSYIASLSIILNTDHDFGLGSLSLRAAPFALTTVAFTLIYTLIPNCVVKVWHALVGGVLVAVMFELAKSTFTLYVRVVPTYDIVYGAFAAIPLFLLWLYFSWLIVLFGGQLVCHLEKFFDETREMQYPPLMESLVLLDYLQNSFSHGREGSREDFMARTRYRLGEERWNGYMSRFMAAGWLAKSEGKNFILARDLDAVSLYDLFRMLNSPMPSVEELPVRLRGGEVWVRDFRSRVEAVQRVDQQAMGISIEKLLLSSRADPGSPADAVSWPDTGTQSQ